MDWYYDRPLGGHVIGRVNHPPKGQGACQKTSRKKIKKQNAARKLAGK